MQEAKTAAPLFRQTTEVVIKDEMPTLFRGWHFHLNLHAHFPPLAMYSLKSFLKRS
jgi:hypothetical protein